MAAENSGPWQFNTEEIAHYEPKAPRGENPGCKDAAAVLAQHLRAIQAKLGDLGLDRGYYHALTFEANVGCFDCPVVVDGAAPTAPCGMSVGYSATFVCPDATVRVDGRVPLQSWDE